MKTFDNYDTEKPRAGDAILSRILVQLLESPDCKYSFRSKFSEKELDNWNARCIISALRFGTESSIDLEQN